MFEGSAVGFGLWVVSIVIASVKQQPSEEFDYAAIFLSGITFVGAGFFIGGFITRTV